MNQLTAVPIKWYHRLGPGLITACVVIGPGSITTSTQVGATHGFALTWVVLVAVVFMMTFMQLSRLSRQPNSCDPASGGRLRC
jgi:Mn2+/Fe2+ NRAMP family transporter